MKRSYLLAAALMLCSATVVPGHGAPLSPLEQLGKKIFFDGSLSNPPGQSCASCHVPATGGTGPDSTVNAAGAVEPGAIFVRAGNRKPPTFAYAGFTPLLHKSGTMIGGGGMGPGGGGMGPGGSGMTENTFAGGLFWDGRATGWVTGDPLAEQAMGPFLNPLEMNNPNARFVCLSVQRANYAVLFEDVWGPGTLDCVKDVDGTYQRIARSIAAYERSAEVSPFNSRFDAFWRNADTKRRTTGGVPQVWAINMMNKARFSGLGLSDMELSGLVIFNSKGKCSTCHPLQPMHGSAYPLFTDFRYHNLGVPKNPQNPYYDMPAKWNSDGAAWVDMGLGGFLARTGNSEYNYVPYAGENIGKHRTPTLRNVDLRPSPDFVKAYGHNGFFKSLQEIVHFYNLRDVLPLCESPDPPKDAMGGATCFPPAEVAQNVNRADMGNLGLTPQEGMALIGFLKTLSDGYTAAAF